MEHPLILFDGVCNFCDASVNFILRRDCAGRFRFAPLQSEAGKKILEKFHLPSDDLNTMILIEDEKIYIRSTAALRIARRLKWPWPLMTAFLLIPYFLRDFVYGIVAKNRYRWFGKKEFCMIPAPEWRDRFLEKVD